MIPPLYRWLWPTETDVVVDQSAAIATAILNHRQLDHQTYLEPDRLPLPPASAVFPDLGRAVRCLAGAIALKEPILICGDYDADGMTSTALLLRALRHLGATVDYAIPSRHHEGYGINGRIVQDAAAAGVKLIITVDNGIAAFEPIAIAKSLGLSVIITDHHDLPPELPPADAILNPKQIADDSAYAGMAGVGVAYLLALELGQGLGAAPSLNKELLALLTLGTIADLAALTGINRRWVKQGLATLADTTILGIQALLNVTGLAQKQPLLPEAIGFGLGPRINAVGRIGDPQVVIELLTTTDPAVAQQRALDCENLNRQRQALCQQIEAAAIAHVEAASLAGHWQKDRDRVLVLLGEDWHHGVIGIVASRLVERYAVPVFIATPDAAGIRGSARGIPHFHVYEALASAADLLAKFGGHPAAGGFSLATEQWPAFVTRLQQFARQHLSLENLIPSLAIDTCVPLAGVTQALYDDLYRMQPCGMGNPEPLLASRNVKVIHQAAFGKGEATHLKLSLVDASTTQPLEAILWRGAELMPIPERLDIAYTLRLNVWRDRVRIDLDIKALRGAEPEILAPMAPPIANQPYWQSLDQMPPQALIYGWQRPTLEGDYGYDRPQHPHTDLVLWSWPPSQAHLDWLLATTQPQHVHLRAQIVPLPDTLAIQQAVHEAIWQAPKLEVLRLGQALWLAPDVLVAASRSLGWQIPNYPATPNLFEALQAQAAWYQQGIPTAAQA